MKTSRFQKAFLIFACVCTLFTFNASSQCPCIVCVDLYSCLGGNDSYVIVNQGDCVQFYSSDIYSSDYPFYFGFDDDPTEYEIDGYGIDNGQSVTFDTDGYSDWDGGTAEWLEIGGTYSGYYQGTVQVVVPTAAISSFSPNATDAQDSSGNGFTLTVNGNTFQPGCKVSFNGDDTYTSVTFIDSTKLYVDVPAFDLDVVAPLKVDVVVENPDGTASLPAEFQIDLPTPIFPPFSMFLDDGDFATADAGTAFDLTILGEWFAPVGCLVDVNGVLLSPSQSSGLGTSSSSVTVKVPGSAIPASVLASSGYKESTTVYVRVENHLEAQESDYEPFTVTVPSPGITSLSSYSAITGSAGFDLILNGDGFLPGCTVNFGSDPSLSIKSSSLEVSPTSITAVVPAADIASGGTMDVYVTNPDGETSPVVPFNVYDDVSISSLSPSSVDARLSTGFNLDLTINGAGLYPGSTVNFGGTYLYVESAASDGSSLQALVPDSLLKTAGSQTVTVYCATTASSDSQSFTINPLGPPPAIACVAPASGVCSDPIVGANSDQILQLNGTGFQSGAKIFLYGSSCQTGDSTLTPKTITVSDVPTSDPTTLQFNFALGNNAQNWFVTVENPDGQYSSSVPFTVQTPVPAIDSLSPDASYAGVAQDVPLTVYGSTFECSAFVNWNGTALPTTPIVSSDGLVIGLSTAIPYNDIADAVAANTSGAYPFTVPAITVNNPDNGTTSGTANYTINSGPPLGLDIYNAQDPVNWPTVASQDPGGGGKSFAYIKVSQGIACYNGNVAKSVIATDVPGAQQNGLLVGVYHYADIFANGTGGTVKTGCAAVTWDGTDSAIRQNATNEAMLFLNQGAQYLGCPFLPPSLDIEGEASQYGFGANNDAKLDEWMSTWIQVVQSAAIGINPVIYGGQSTMNKLVNPSGDSSIFTTYPDSAKWIADYTGTSPTSEPSYSSTEFPDWTIKQYTDSGTCPGIGGNGGIADLDSFNGDMTSLELMTAVTPTLPAPVIQTAANSKSQYTITMTDLNPVAVIYYTTDGTTPEPPIKIGNFYRANFSTYAYSGPFSVSLGVTIRAVAVENGSLEIPSVGSTYNESAVAYGVPGAVLATINNIQIENPDPVYSLTASGNPGSLCILQASADLINWFPVATNTFSTNAIAPGGLGAAVLVDTVPQGVPVRFYRVAMTPAKESYTVTLQPGMNLIANKLDNGSSNTLNQLFPNSGALDGDQIQKLNSDGSYGFWVFDSTSPTGFSDQHGNHIATTTLLAGSGAFYNNTHSNATTVTFSGAADFPVLPAPLPYGLNSTNILSAQGDRPGTYLGITGFAPAQGSQMQVWNNVPGGTGYFTVYNFTGGAWSPVAPPTLNVGESALFVVPGYTLPFIRKQPTSVFVGLGTTTSFSVTPADSPPVSYQWLFNGASINGANSSNYFVPNVKASSAGAYSVVLANNFGTVTSSVAMLNVLTPVTNAPSSAFTGLTPSQSITAGASAITLSGTLSGPGPVYPALGETITVTINSNAKTTAINDSTGDFSFTYKPSSIPASATPYPIVYSYGGDGSLSAASNASTTLTVNPPGYQSYTIRLPVGYSLIANQLNNGSNTFTQVLPCLQTGDAVFLYQCSNYIAYYYFPGSPTGFYDSNFNPIAQGTLPPGQGALYQNNQGVTETNIFTGTPNVPVLPATLPCGFGQTNLLSCQTNTIGTYENITGYSPTNGAQVQRFNGSGYNIYNFTNGAWSPSTPTLNVGESAFFIVPNPTNGP